MAKYILAFNSRSKSMRIPRAISLVKSAFIHSYYELDGFIIIECDKITRSFKGLLELVRTIKGTKVEVDSELVPDINELMAIINCSRKRYCNGICIILKDYYFQLEFLGITGRDHSAFCNTARWDIYEYDDVIVEFQDHLVIKRDLFLEHYIDDTLIAKKVCSSYCLERIEQRFSELPEIIIIEKVIDPSDISEALANAPSTEIDMTVHLSKESIEAIGEQIAKRLRELNHQK